MDPYKKLAAALESRMVGHAAATMAGIPSELGTVTGSGLKLDSFKHEIQDYWIADWEIKMKLPAFTLSGSVAGQSIGDTPGKTEFQFDEAEIEDVKLLLRDGLKPGDRVLAIPVAGGSEAVVLCKVVR